MTVHQNTSDEAKHDPSISVPGQVKNTSDPHSDEVAKSTDPEYPNYSQVQPDNTLPKPTHPDNTLPKPDKPGRPDQELPKPDYPNKPGQPDKPGHELPSKPGFEKPDNTLPQKPEPKK